MEVSSDYKSQVTVGSESEENKHSIASKAVPPPYLEIEEIQLTCTGEIDSAEATESPFNYTRYQTFRVTLKKLQRLERSLKIKHGFTVDEKIEDPTDSNLSLTMQSEFGPLDTVSESYNSYLEAYKKAYRKTLTGEEDMLKSERYLKRKIHKVKEKLNWSLKRGATKLQSLEEMINSQHVDWFDLPRLNLARVDKRHKLYLQKVIAEGGKIIEDVGERGSEKSTVFVVPKVAPLNLIFFDPMISIPSEIFYSKISEEEALKLKAVILEFPNGLTFDEYIMVYTSNYGSQPNFLPFGSFAKMVEELPDIFLIPDAAVLGRRLLFPAYWFGILKTINVIMAKLCHWIKFLVNYNGGSIFSDDVFPQLEHFFNIHFQPEDWGFNCIEEFFDCISACVMPQPAFTVSYDETTGKCKLYFKDCPSMEQE